MPPHTFGKSNAAVYLSRVLAMQNKAARRKASSSMAEFNRTMKALSSIDDRDVRIRMIQSVPSTPATEHSPLVTSLMTNLRATRKKKEMVSTPDTGGSVWILNRHIGDEYCSKPVGVWVGDKPTATQLGNIFLKVGLAESWLASVVPSLLNTGWLEESLAWCEYSLIEVEKQSC